MSDEKIVKKVVTLPENTVVDYTFEKLLKEFLKRVDKSGVLKEVKARRYYIKPSEKKRQAKKDALRRKK